MDLAKATPFKYSFFKLCTTFPQILPTNGCTDPANGVAPGYPAMPPCLSIGSTAPLYGTKNVKPVIQKLMRGK